MRHRTTALVGLLAGLGLATAFILWEVLGTVFFAITIAYVLLPVRRALDGRGLSRRMSSAVATTLAFFGLVVVTAPFAVVLYQRWEGLLTFLRSVPATIPVEIAGMTYTVDVAAVLATGVRVAREFAVAALRASPVLAMKAVLFTFVVYGLLLKPEAARDAAFKLVPENLHDVVLALHRRTDRTLRALYILQFLTAVVTFVAAFVVFVLLGYRSPLALALVAGVLQFIPVVGPSILVLGLVVVDLVVGNTVRALILAVVGLVVIGFLPDAIVRPRLATQTTELPVSLYFVGFVGGVLSLGVVGFIAGPLVVALLVEVVALVSASTHHTTEL